MSAADRFRAGVEAGDIEAALAALADDVVLHSPVTFRPFEGKPAVSHVLRTVFGVFEDFRYTDQLSDAGATHGLVFEARVGDRSVQGIDFVRENADGLIDDFTVMVRPLSGLTSLAEEMRRRLGAPPS